MPTSRARLAITLLSALAAAAAITGCARSSILPHVAGGQLVAIGAESQYADVISQIGGRYVAVSAVEHNPNTDPHSFEASPAVARAIGAARLVVQNGLGYDSFMNRLEAATPSRQRHVISIQRLLGLPDSTANPHLWYSPRTMPALAAELVRTLSALQPAHRAYFAANAARFERSLRPWLHALGELRRREPGAPVAATEPVGNYLLAAAGNDNLTPWSLQADVMNGVDPAAQDISLQHSLLSSHRVRALTYNAQVTDSLTQQFLASARAHHVPVVALYETMPAGFHYQSWMLAETRALAQAIEHGRSTRRL